MGSAATGVGLGAGIPALFCAAGFLRALGAAALFAGARRALGFGAGFLWDLTRPKAFLIFWTLGSDIPMALATCAPDLPALRSFFTLARTDSVITARFLALGGEGFLDRPEPPLEARSAETNSSVEAKP